MADRLIVYLCGAVPKKVSTGVFFSFALDFQWCSFTP